MPAEIQHENDNLFRVHISGLLRKAELEEVQSIVTRHLQELGTIRILFVLFQFEGWESGADWGDLDFYLTHGDQIEKIAVIGDERWRDEALTFAGAGVRQGEVRFFLPQGNTEALAWLSPAVQ